jgi:FKBP-type peptidyl-prolyl cis-trans isomerase
MTPYRRFLFLFSFLTLLFSCGDTDSPFPGYEKTETGLNYKFYKQNENGVMPDTGQYVVVTLLTYRNDTLIYDSRKRISKPTLEYPVSRPKFKGAIEEGLMMMSIGDSASFIIPSDSIQKYFSPVHDSLSNPPGSMLRFEVKLHAVKTLDQIKEERAKAIREMLGNRKQQEPVLIEEYLARNSIETKHTESGMYFVEVIKGKGKTPKLGDSVTVHYIGRFTDDREFDSSVKRDDPYTFKLGSDKKLPQGWTEALLRMKKGGKAVILLPSKLAFDSLGKRHPIRGDFIIPPYTPLVFELQLLEVK